MAVNAIDQNGTQIGSLVLVHDMSYMVRRSADTRNYVIMLFIVLGVVVSLITGNSRHTRGKRPEKRRRFLPARAA